jgi:hypothetical protein
MSERFLRFSLQDALSLFSLSLFHSLQSGFRLAFSFSVKISLNDKWLQPILSHPLIY